MEVASREDLHGVMGIWKNWAVNTCAGASSSLSFNSASVCLALPPVDSRILREILHIGTRQQLCVGCTKIWPPLGVIDSESHCLATALAPLLLAHTVLLRTHKVQEKAMMVERFGYGKLESFHICRFVHPKCPNEWLCDDGSGGQ